MHTRKGESLVNKINWFVPFDLLKYKINKILIYYKIFIIYYSITLYIVYLLLLHYINVSSKFFNLQIINKDQSKRPLRKCKDFYFKLKIKRDTIRPFSLVIFQSILRIKGTRDYTMFLSTILLSLHVLNSET